MKFFTVIVLIIPLSISCMNIPDNKKKSIGTIDFQQAQKFVNEFFKGEYSKYSREQSEKIVKEIVNNNIDLNKTRDFNLDWQLDINGSKPCRCSKATLLGYCIFRDKHDSSGSVLADILVSNGAQLSGSCDHKFGFYFIKKISDFSMVNYDILTPTTKLFETLLYRRIQYCLQKACISIGLAET